MKLFIVAATIFIILLGYIFFELYKNARDRRERLTRVKGRKHSPITMEDPDPTNGRRDRKEDYVFRSVR